MPALMTRIRDRWGVSYLMQARVALTGSALLIVTITAIAARLI